MVQIVNRIAFNNGTTLHSGVEWPDDPKFIVGPIFFVEAYMTKYDIGDEETTPAYYEVWQVPPDFLPAVYALDFEAVAASLNGISELKLLRVWLEGNILFVEERWPAIFAGARISGQIKEAFEEASEEARLMSSGESNGGLQQQAIVE